MLKNEFKALTREEKRIVAELKVAGHADAAKLIERLAAENMALQNK
jgi:hypothetical protein